MAQHVWGDSLWIKSCRECGLFQILGEALKKLTGENIIYQQVSYLMRSGAPDALDLMVAVNYANMAMTLIASGASGRMVALRDGTYTHIPMSTVTSGGDPVRAVLRAWEPSSGSTDVDLDADATGFGPPAVAHDGAAAAVAVCGEWRSARVVTANGVVALGDSGCGRAVDLDRTGTLLAVQSEEGQVTVFDIASHRDAGWMTTPTPRVMSVQHQPATAGWVAFSPDESRLLTAGADGAARVWEVPSGEPLLALDTGGGPVEVALWTPDGDRVVTSSRDGVPRVWDARTGRLEAELPAYSTWPHLAVSPDGRWLLTSADGVVQAWALQADTLVEMAQDRLTRGLTETECERYGVDPCPVPTTS